MVGYIKKQVRRVKKAVKGRYFSGSGYSKPKINQMGKDIMYLKSVLNPEKKVFQQFGTNVGLGQVNGNANGYYALDITPIPAQGTTSVTRNGNSIKLHSLFMRFQFQQQANTANQVKVRIYIVLIKGTPNTSVGAFPAGIMLDPNPFVTGGGSIYDYHSSTNPDYFGTWKIIRKKDITVKNDSVSGNNMITDFGLPIKYFRGKGHHIRYAQDGSQQIADGQLLMVVLADNGNVSGTTPSTLAGITTGSTAINTGCLFNYNMQHYFYDN